MRRPAALVCLGVAVFTLTAAYAADLKDLPKGPALGDEKYTVHRAGMLSDVVLALAKQVGRPLYLNVPRAMDGTVTPGKAITPVTLDFDGATLNVILDALCRQAGMVYRSQPWNRGIEIAEGDPDIDTRPTTVAGDYIVRAVSSNFQSESSIQLGWGLAIPDTPDIHKSFSIGLEIIPRTAEAGRYLAGVGSQVVATTDKGAKLDSNTQGWGPGGYQPLQRNDWGWGGGEQPPPPLQLPAPPAGVRMLTKVEGNLRAYSVVKVAELKIKPDTEGQAVTLDDVSATLKSWKTNGSDTQVSLEITSPSLPKSDRNNYYADRRVAVLVGKDGRKQFGGINGSMSNDNTVYKVSYQFNPRYYGFGIAVEPGVAPPPFEPDYLLLTVTRYGDADKTIPFVLENVPVP